MDSVGENPGACRAEVVGDQWKPDGVHLGSDGELGYVARSSQQCRRLGRRRSREIWVRPWLDASTGWWIDGDSDRTVCIEE